MKKLLLSIAAMLLVQVNAFAQINYDAQKADVNGDGVVDVADLTAVIKIMKDGGGTGTVENEIEGAVDLGLSVLWATCNVGAEKPEEYGNYYAWGEVETKNNYTQHNYIRDVYDASYFNSIGSDISGSEYYDAATKELGQPWRMPKLSEISELVDKCSWSRATSNDVAGFIVTGPNGNSIFIPAAGSNVEGTVYSGSYANLWSSEPLSPNHYMCYRLMANQSGAEVSTFPGFYGCSVRPVCDKNEINPGGGGDQGGGDGWVSVNATGYAPYYYCPTTGTTTPSTKVATSIRAYRNTSTGAYKVNWAGTDYPCNAGYNKLTLGTTSHTTTNSYGNTVVCTDYYYLEFTISN